MHSKDPKGANMVPIFSIPDKSVKTKLLVDAIRGECGAEVVDLTDPKTNYVV